MLCQSPETCYENAELAHIPENKLPGTDPPHREDVFLITNHLFLPCLQQPPAEKQYVSPSRFLKMFTAYSSGGTGKADKVLVSCPYQGVGYPTFTANSWRPVDTAEARDTALKASM